MRAASILYCLSCKPNVAFILRFNSLEVEVAVERLVALSFLARRILEQKDNADRVELLERLWVERDEFFELDVADTEAFDKESEDAENRLADRL